MLGTQGDAGAHVALGGAAEHASSTLDAAPGSRPSLCTGCHNHTSLRLPWTYIPETVAADIESFIYQPHSLYHNHIIDDRVMDQQSPC